MKKIKERRTVGTGSGDRDRIGGEGGGEGENKEWHTSVKKKTTKKRSRGSSEILRKVRELLRVRLRERRRSGVGFDGEGANVGRQTMKCGPRFSTVVEILFGFWSGAV